MQTIRIRQFSIAVLMLGVLSSTNVFGQATATKTKQADKKVVERVDVELDGGKLTLKIPKTWKKVPSSSRMRKGTFEIPTAKGETDKGELAIFNFPGNQVNANIVRWIGQFDGKGRKAKTVQGKAGENQYYIVNISGTYNKSVGPPIQRKTEPHENYRMLGVILPIEGKGMYFLKLSGPDKTVAAQLKNLRKSFGGKKATEKDYEM